ncbi:MAG: NAD(+)/NADH kinase [Anaerolineae bacterium]|nr:NAD(+)/NADH kinase [Anaerolineae bacterium]
MDSAQNGRIATAGVFQNPYIPAAASLAQDVVRFLCQHEIALWESQRLDREDVARKISATDLLLVLGGDGSILRAARLTAGHSTLILGINLGRMGFLTEAEPDAWPAVLSRVLAGNYWIEERMMIRAAAHRGKELLAQQDALNDVVVGQGALGRVVRLEARIDRDLLTHYVADALIVATPTGSTAYALSAGGPIMPPRQRNILLVPVAPHLSLDRAVVLAEGVEVRVVVHGHTPASFTVDGTVIAELVDGDVVTVQASPHQARFARVRDRDYFYRTLTARLVPRERDHGP